MRTLDRHLFSVSRQAYRRQTRTLVRLALAEDVGPGDLTTAALAFGRETGGARIIARRSGVLDGCDAIAEVFRQLDRHVTVNWRRRDGERFRRGESVATFAGPSAAILTGERTALNFLSHLSGIATATHALAAKIPRNTARLLDTRKTTPGWRLLEKHAARSGGALNHRLGLYDAVMIKDNHIAAAGGLAEAIRRVLSAKSRRIVICEIALHAQLDIALHAGVDWLLLDNFTPERLRQAVRLIRGFEAAHKARVRIEASGNITARNIDRMARTGVDFISVGAITHSAPAVDFSLEWIALKRGRSA